MDNVFFDNPPALQGDEIRQLQQLYSYLYAMSEKLNAAMIEVDVQTKQEIRSTATGQAKTQAEGFGTLKSLIIKTAEIVRTEMQEISTQLHGETMAVSAEVGTLEQTLDTTIRATAEGVLQDYHFSELVTDTNTNTFYRTQTNQYIFTGILDTNTGKVGIAIGDGVTAYDANGNPYLNQKNTSFRQMTNQYIFTGLISDNPVQYGIAIGQGVTDYDPITGTPFLNQNAKAATFTMDKLAFWQGTTELAYFSSGKFYITNGEITNTLQIGNFVWKKMADDSMVLVRI